MRILALTFGDESCPSTWYRLLQYKPFLAEDGFELVHCPAKDFEDFQSIRDYDAVVLQKTILSKGKVAKIAKLARYFLYDADDRIWLRPFRSHHWLTRMRINIRMRSIAARADTCIAANSVIAADLRRYGASTAIIPMALSGETWFPPERRDAPLTIGWTGSPANLPFLKVLLPIIEEIQGKHPEVRWVLHSGANPRWDSWKYEYHPFEKGKEPQVVRSFDVGLLPLPDDEFVKGKSPIKGLQYLASGTAMICSRTPATLDFSSGKVVCLYADAPEEWHSAIDQLIKDSSLLKEISANGRERFMENHDLGQTYLMLAKALKRQLLRLAKT